MAANSRKTEVTKLITVTLGKIQESKHAKCGLNLRKSLLVASVLHKARDIYVTEVKSRVSNHTDSSMKTSDINNKKEDSSSVPAKVRRFASQRSMSIIEEEQVTSSQDDDNVETPVRPSAILSTASSTTGSNIFNDNDEVVSSTTSCENIDDGMESTQSNMDDILDDLATSSEVEYATTTDKENSPPAEGFTATTSLSEGNYYDDKFFSVSLSL